MVCSRPALLTHPLRGLAASVGVPLVSVKRQTHGASTTGPRCSCTNGHAPLPPPPGGCMTAIAARMARIRVVLPFGAPPLGGFQQSDPPLPPWVTSRGAGCAGRLFDPPEGGTPNGSRPPPCPGWDTSKGPVPARTNGHAPPLDPPCIEDCIPTDDRVNSSLCPRSRDSAGGLVRDPLRGQSMGGRL